MVELEQIFRRIFNSPELNLSRSLDSSQVEEWDSLNNLKLIIAIEAHYGIRFSATDVMGLENVGQLYDLIQRIRSK